MTTDVQQTSNAEPDVGDSPGGGMLPLEQLSLVDVEAVRKILTGSSVVDWKRFNVQEREQVVGFLKIMGFRPALEQDIARIARVRTEAIRFLEQTFHFEIPNEIAEPPDELEVFMLAGGEDGAVQRLACAVLKVMHIVHRLDARELLHRLPLSEQALFERVERRVLSVIEGMRAAGFGIEEVATSRKERGSVITKLLSKKSALAAQVYDRSRFRIVTREKNDIVPLLCHLSHHLFPFNYVVPTESRNDVIDLAEVLRVTPLLSRLERHLQTPLDHQDHRYKGEVYNEFSGRDFRMISFAAEVPVRVEVDLAQSGRLFDQFGPAVYLMTEFQVFDLATWEANDRGDASHAAYKERQEAGVLRRLVTPGGVSALKQD